MFGAARSGTSLACKLFNAHPKIKLLMESKLGCRARHAKKHWAWHIPILHKRVFFSRLDFRNSQCEWYGTKVGTPDVWGVLEQNQIAHYFDEAKFVFVVRDPYQNAISRLQREDYLNEYNLKGRELLGYVGLTQIQTYFCNWENSIKSVYALRAMGHQVSVVYYEDLVKDVKASMEPVLNFLELDWSNDILNWSEEVQYDSDGSRAKNLKYTDKQISLHEHDLKQYKKFFDNNKPSEVLYKKFLERAI